MGSSYESWIDRQIREAEERGEFDNLPGAGKPLPDRGELYDENWWLKQWVIREQITGAVPTSLKVRKEVDELAQTLAALSAEADVRRTVADLNSRIEQVQRGHVDGPPVVVSTVDVDEVVRTWREQRGQGQERGQGQR